MGEIVKPEYFFLSFYFSKLLIIIIIIDDICIAPFKGPKAALHGEQTNKQTNKQKGQIIK